MSMVTTMFPMHTDTGVITPSNLFSHQIIPEPFYIPSAAPQIPSF